MIAECSDEKTGEASTNASTWSSRLADDCTRHWYLGRTYNTNAATPVSTGIHTRTLGQHLVESPKKSQETLVDLSQ